MVPIARIQISCFVCLSMRSQRPKRWIDPEYWKTIRRPGRSPSGTGRAFRFEPSAINGDVFNGSRSPIPCRDCAGRDTPRPAHPTRPAPASGALFVLACRGARFSPRVLSARAARLPRPFPPGRCRPWLRTGCQPRPRPAQSLCRRAKWRQPFLIDLGLKFLRHPG